MIPQAEPAEPFSGNLYERLKRPPLVLYERLKSFWDHMLRMMKLSVALCNFHPSQGENSCMVGKKMWQHSEGSRVKSKRESSPIFENLCTVMPKTHSSLFFPVICISTYPFWLKIIWVGLDFCHLQSKVLILI